MNNLTMFDFSEALRLMKQGRKVCRAGWNGKGMWIALSFTDGPQIKDASDIWGTNAQAYAESLGGKATINPFISMKTADGAIQHGWLASQTDMLAEDWQIVD